MTCQQLMTLQQRIRCGIAWLDAYGPRSWRSKIARAIKADRLDLADTEHCILGEIYGDYHEGLRRLGLLTGAPLGFVFQNHGRPQLYRVLTHEWKRLYRDGQALARKARKARKAQHA